MARARTRRDGDDTRDAGLEAACGWLGMFTQVSIEQFIRFMKQGGLTVPQLCALMNLFHEGDRTVGDIAAFLEVTAAAASQVIDRLVDRGLVGRTEAADDRRYKRLTLTAAGRTLIAEAREQQAQHVRAALAALPDEQRVVVGQAFQYLAAATGRHDRGHAGAEDGG